jgi:hypothetical protein
MKYFYCLMWSFLLKYLHKILKDDFRLQPFVWPPPLTVKVLGLIRQKRMFLKPGTHKRRVCGRKTGLVGLAIWGLVISGSVVLDTALGVTLDGGDGTVILVALNHPGTPEQHLGQLNLQSKLPEINLSSFGDGNDDNREEAFSHSPSWTLMSGHKTLAAISDVNDRRTALAYHYFDHLKVMPTTDTASNSTSAFLFSTPRPLQLFRRPSLLGVNYD